jgi:hypothetical protein
MRSITKVFTNVVSTTMLAEYTAFVLANKINVETAVYYKDGVNHYFVITYIFVS